MKIDNCPVIAYRTRMPSVLDATDQALLVLLQEDARLTNVELGKRLRLSAPSIHARVRRLEREGIIRRYVALLEPELLGRDLVCFVQITLQLHSSERVEQFREAVRVIPEVLECHHVTGEYDYLLKVIVGNRKELEELVVYRLTPLPGVARIHTSLALSTIKETTALPVG